MGTQGPGRKRHPNREKLSAEDHALNQIAREAEARLAAKRAARAEAREIRMKELERQQKEIYQVQKKYYGLDTKWGDIEQWMEDSERYSHRPRRNLQASDEDDVMSVTSRSSLRTNGYEEELLGAAQYRKSSRSAYYSDLSLASAPLTAKSPQQSVHNGSRPSLLNCNSLPSRSQRGSLYDEGGTSSSRRSSSSRPPSEYSCYLGSGSRASSRASSARASPVVEERSDKDFAEKSGRPVSSLSAATLASLGGTSSRRGSGDTSISVDTEASIREIKEISELKEQIEDVEGKYMQGLKEMKDSLAEVEEKYKRSMVTNAQLDNEKTSLQYQVDTLREVLLELEEELAESRRQYEDKQKECERQKHDQGVLRFQLAEMKEALEQREALMTEIRQLQQKQDVSDREICDLKETIEWKDKKIGALERQKEFFDPVRSERDTLREEVTHLREVLKKHGIVLDSEGTLNGDASIDHHVNSDGPPDPPVRAVSMGKTEETIEKMDSTSAVGECPPTETEQDAQEIAQDVEKDIQLPAKGGDVTNLQNEEVNNSKIEETEPVDLFGHHKSDIDRENQEGETSVDLEDKKETSQTKVLENISEVDGEATLKQSDESPSGSEVFQDAVDFVDETPSTTSEIDEDVSGCASDSEKEEPKSTEAGQCSIHGPQEGAEALKDNVNICTKDESNTLEGKQDGLKESSTHEDLSTELSEKMTTDKIVDVEHEDQGDDEIKPQQTQQVESGSLTTEDQSKTDAILSAESLGDIDQGKGIPAPEQHTEVTSNDLVAQVESENDKTSDASGSKRNSIIEDEVHVVPQDSSSQNVHKHVPDNEREEVSLESEDLKSVEQREEDTLSRDVVSDNSQTTDDTSANEAETPKETVPPEVFSSEGESSQEVEDTDDDDDDSGATRSEKYTGESEMPCPTLGSSVDRQSLEDIRMDDASDKSPKRGKGKNKEDCVVS
ncbi:hypothetical protein GDO81_017264 [Engystomops pustulosus]|uniref:Leucine-rich repeat flightless-interacting protein 1 n=1 Tax=Engystomops pustulosus TaxID=76066 RepID=A0AAV7AC88_ENGPU|nr:hypothetical protein GDO81_017264 [Engystomops pustulosus]